LPCSTPVAAARADRSSAPALAFLYEHPKWFAPIFAELDRRGTPYTKIYAPDHHYDVDAPLPGFRVLFNRMSPSADRRDHGTSILHTLAYLGHLELSGIRVLNGSKAFRFEISKALQLSLLRSLGIAHPRSRVIHDPQHAVAAAQGLRYPVVVKPNVGGSGAGIVRFDTEAQLVEAITQGTLGLGFDHIALVQEFIPARGGHITRVETIGYKYLYGINVYTPGDTFDLCPMDICKTNDGTELSTTCVIEGAKTGLRVEAYRPPDSVIASVEKIFAEAQIEVGGVEYTIDDRDGQLYFYDVNALSNFVADAPRVIGFDPFDRLVDYLVKERR